MWIHRIVLDCSVHACRDKVCWLIDLPPPSPPMIFIYCMMWILNRKNVISIHSSRVKKTQMAPQGVTIHQILEMEQLSCLTILVSLEIKPKRIRTGSSISGSDYLSTIFCKAPSKLSLEHFQFSTS